MLKWVVHIALIIFCCSLLFYLNRKWVFTPVAVKLQQDTAHSNKTQHKTKRTIKDTLHTMNTMQIQLQLQQIQLNKVILIKNKYTIHCTVILMKYVMS
jgi:hypothetical protein